jgi:glycosyltransferase involved in cell wall biosynthesis
MPRSLSIVIPAYNEEARLPATLRQISAWLDAQTWSFREIVVVDDGSRDRTAEAAARFAGVRVLRNPGNRGKGYSVRHGMLEARGEWILFSDADLSTPIEEAGKLWAAAGENDAHVAIGSRALDRSLIGVHQPAIREASGRLFNLLMRAITGLPFRDTQCGFKLFEAGAAKDVFRRQALDGFGFDVEVLALARARGYRVVEVPVRWDNAEGTKVGLGGGVEAFFDLLRVRWNLLRGRYGDLSRPAPELAPADRFRE